MRYLKKLLSAVLIYIAAFLTFIAILQAVTGYDYSPAYAAVTGVGAVELIVGCIIKVTEAREESKLRKDGERDAGEYP
jgi:multidrug transporter EmrE-like cation transporter